MRRRRRLAALSGLLAAAVTGSLAAITFLPAEAAVSSALTKRGSGEFAGLQVTVSKTKGLINETVTVTWKGGTPTTPIQRPERDFVQLMQCWGDAAAGPKPEQCQFGALGNALDAGRTYSTLAGRQVALREANVNFPADGKQTVPDSWKDPLTGSFVPFRSVSGVTVSGAGGKTEFYDIQGTNEIPIAATKANGTGVEFFEVQTATEAPGLGCGTPITRPDGRKVGRGCFLVVVPRSKLEVDGSIRDDSAPDERLRRLQTSPLSASNWAERIVFPLDFQPIGGNCPLGAPQLTVLGGEPATEAVSRWQTSLCQSTKTVFDFNQVPDTTGRTNVTGAKPALAVLGGPLTGTPATGAPVYAPLAVSGLGFAANIEIRTSDPNPAPEIKSVLGRRFDDIKLTPRLVAKLLTQSYRNATNNTESVPAGNPASIEVDPEFLELNPFFRKPAVNGGNPAVSSALVSLNPADANALVWQWIAGDAEARDFLAGKEAPGGMVVNARWKNVQLAGRADFPQLDQVCKKDTTGAGAPDLCSSNTHPYAIDMHEAVRASARGDTLTRTNWDASATPPTYRAGDPQFKGSRAMLAYADSATAARYNLPMVRLRNASGNFVAPTNRSLAAGLAAMKRTAVAGVVAPNPGAKGADVYPLTFVSYAVTVPAGLSADARKAYAGFIRYASGTGQVPGDQPGQLPAGYVPLPRAMKATAAAAASAIEKYRPTSPRPTSTPGPGANSGGGGGGGGGMPAPGPDAPPVPPAPPAPPGAAVPPPVPTDTAVFPTPTPPSTTPGTTPVVGATPALATGKSAKALLWLLLIFGLAVIGTQALPRLQPLASGRATATRKPPPPGPPAASSGAPEPPGGDAGA